MTDFSPFFNLRESTKIERENLFRVGTKGTLEQILFGPTSVNDGTQNLVGALKTAMGVCGALTIKDMHKAELVIAPAIKTEGKLFQQMKDSSSRT